MVKTSEGQNFIVASIGAGGGEFRVTYRLGSEILVPSSHLQYLLASSLQRQPVPVTINSEQWFMEKIEAVGFFKKSADSERRIYLNFPASKQASKQESHLLVSSSSLIRKSSIENPPAAPLPAEINRL